MRRVLPVLLGVVVVAVAGGIALAWVSDEVSAAPATLLSIVLLAVLGYGLVRLHVGPILRWALHRTFGSLFRLLPMTTRALPLLLLAITFLFVNTEVWQVASNLALGQLLAGRRAVPRARHGVPPGPAARGGRQGRRRPRRRDAASRCCAGTPVEEACRELVAEDGADPASYAEVTGYERWNLVLVLVVIQGVQVLLLTLSVFLFLLVFGSLIMTEPVMDVLAGHDGERADPGPGQGLGVPRRRSRGSTSPSRRSPTRPTASSSSAT